MNFSPLSSFVVMAALSYIVTLSLATRKSVDQGILCSAET